MRTPTNKARPVFPGYVVGRTDAPWQQRLVVAVVGGDIIWARPSDCVAPECVHSMMRRGGRCGRRRFVTWCRNQDELRIPTNEDYIDLGEDKVMSPGYFKNPYA